jgi:hypothetical protein
MYVNDIMTVRRPNRLIKGQFLVPGDAGENIKMGESQIWLQKSKSDDDSSGFEVNLIDELQKASQLGNHKSSRGPDFVGLEVA